MKLGIAVTCALYLIAMIMTMLLIWLLFKGVYWLECKSLTWLRERRREPTTHGDDGGRPSNPFNPYGDWDIR